MRGSIVLVGRGGGKAVISYKIIILLCLPESYNIEIVISCIWVVLFGKEIGLGFTLGKLSKPISKNTIHLEHLVLGSEITRHRFFCLNAQSMINK